MNNINDKKTNTMHIFLACTQDYFQYVLNIIFSIRLYSKKHIHIHLMIDDNNIQQYQSKLEYYQFEDMSFTVYPTDILDKVLSKNHKTHLSKMTFSRIVLCDLLNTYGIERCLYLDSDVLITNSGIDALYDVDFNGKYAAAIDDIPMMCFGQTELNDCKVKRYFNAGVVLFNIQKIVEDKLNNQFIQLLKTPEEFMITRGFADQSILNMSFKENVVFVDPKYNVQAAILGYKQYENYLHICGYKNGLSDMINKCVVQHMSGAKPWEKRWFEWQTYQLPFKSWMKDNFDKTKEMFKTYLKSKNIDFSKYAI